MLKFDAKRPDWPIDVTWNAYPLIKSFLAADIINTCAVAIAVAPESAVPDPDVASMISGGAAVNNAPVTINDRICPAGTVVTQKIVGGVPGAKYDLTFTPTYASFGVGEGEQMRLDVVDRLPPLP